jgi:hypothetical protein
MDGHFSARFILEWKALAAFLLLAAIPPSGQSLNLSNTGANQMGLAQATEKSLPTAWWARREELPKEQN